MTPSEISILIACEESQEVTKAFRERGFNAFSCDLQDCSGGHPEWHIKKDVRQVLYSRKWAGVIAHPVCTKMANSGVRWFASLTPREGYVWSDKYGVFLRDDPKIWENLEEATVFFNFFIDYGIMGNNITIENPIHHRYAKEKVREQDQIIQPWQFGHQKMKATCLWHYGFPQLIPTDIVGPPPKERAERIKWQDIWMASPGPNRSKIRSKTYPGIAKAIAEQYGNYLLKTL